VYGRQDTVRCDDCSAARRERPVVILCAPAVPGSPRRSGPPDTHRMRTGSTSPLAATVARHTGDRDAVWRGRPESDVASAPMRHPWPEVRGSSSRHVTGVCVPSRYASVSGALAVQHCWHAPAQSHQPLTLRGTAGSQAGGGPVIPNPPAPLPGDPLPRLWSTPPGQPVRACASMPSVSR
jgi:hypothetical protein